MKNITIISDTHGYKPKLPGGDILIHCGDFCNFGNLPDLLSFRNWFIGQKYKHKICIAGNHDMILEQQPESKIHLEEVGIIYLQDTLIEIEGLKIYGSPWTPTFMNWGFMKDRGIDIAEKWANIPSGLDILITHGPPKNIMDYGVYSKQNVGCADLYKKVMEVKPKVHCFGHIHYGYGIKDINGITFINAAQVSESYRLLNRPVEIEL